MRTMSWRAAGLIALAAVLGGCDLVGVRGSGEVVSESREVGDFDQVVLQGSGIARIEVTGEESLSVEAEENLLPLLTSDVADGVLELGATEAISPTEEIVYTITVASLEAVRVQGSGELSAPGVQTDVFEATISGSGEVTLLDLATEELVVRISGSGDAEVSGSTDHLELDVSGSGDYLGDDLVAMTADVSVSGSGNATLNVTENLEATVSGSGTIVYLGEPASVDSSVSGSGEIEEG